MDELAKRFADLAEHYGPKVADAAMQATRVEAYSAMMSSALGLGVACAIALAGRWLWRKSSTADDFDSFPLRAVACLLFVIAFATAAAALWTFIDPWTWVAINHPELWIAKRAFKL